MNRYGRLAQEMWEQLAPTALAEIEDPNRHFSTLGEEALEQVTDLTIQLQGDDQPGETYFAKVGRIENAKLRAEEIVRTELLMPPPDMQEVTDEEIEDNLPPTGIWSVMADLREIRQELRRIEDSDQTDQQTDQLTDQPDLQGSDQTGTDPDQDDLRR